MHMIDSIIIVKMDPAIIILSGNMMHKGNKQKQNKELIKQIYTHISLRKLNRYENTQSNLFSG